MSDSFDWSKYEKPSTNDNKKSSFDWSKYEKPKEKPYAPMSLEGSARAYGSGVAGGAGGLIPDISGMIPEKAKPFVPGAQPLSNLLDVLKAKKTPELTSTIAEKEPQNAMERILREAGIFGGQQGLIDTAIGGPGAGALGLAHGSITGIAYGAAKELGLDDPWALLVAGIATISPLALGKSLPKISEWFKKGKPIEEAAQQLEKELQTGGGKPPGNGGGPPSGGSPPPPSAGRQSIEERMREDLQIPRKEDVVPKEESSPISGKELVPEEAKLKAPSEYLKSDFEIAEDIRNKLSPLNTDLQIASPASTQKLLEPVKDVLNNIERHRINDPNLLGRTAQREINEISNQEYKAASQEWNNAKELASETVQNRPELIYDLEKIVLESPVPARGGEAKTTNFAEELLDKIAPPRKNKKGIIMKDKDGSVIRKSKSISNKQLIESIQNARVGYDYRYSGGIQGHKVNEFINTIEKELSRTASSAERNALLRARNASAEWAQKFKNPQVLPFRAKHKQVPQRLYQSMTNPDNYNVLSSILENSPRGRTLNNLIKRNILEKTLEPYLLRPESFNPLKFERDIGKLQGILSPQEINQVKQNIQRHHEQSLRKPPSLRKSFAQMSEREIASKLKTIKGLRELKQELSRVPGGAKMYEDIARTQGIDLLFGGQMDIVQNSERITRMLNDRNGRFYLKETLGNENIKVLDELAKKNQLEKRMKEISESSEKMELINKADNYVQAGMVIADVMRGRPISAIKKTYTLIKRIGKKQIKNKNPSFESKGSIEIR